MSQRLSTAGMRLMYAVETAAGTRPTTGYKAVPEVKSMPSFNPVPNTIESTDLTEEEYMTYVMGLKDLGGALEYGANLTNDLIDFWDTVMTDYETAVAANKAMWWVVVHPALKIGIYYQGTPSPIGLNEASVGGMLETTLYISPNSGPVRAEKPTPASEIGV